jgi:hypothetical protein
VARSGSVRFGKAWVLGGGMLIKRTSKLTSVTREKEIAVTEDQLEKFYRGLPAKFAMPHLSEDELRFIRDGVTREEYDTHPGYQLAYQKGIA